MDNAGNGIHRGSRFPRTPQEEALLDALDDMDQITQERFFRFATRLANKPEGMELSTEQLQTMLDNDTDIPCQLLTALNRKIIKHPEFAKDIPRETEIIKYIYEYQQPDKHAPVNILKLCFI